MIMHIQLDIAQIATNFLNMFMYYIAISLIYIAQ